MENINKKKLYRIIPVKIKNNKIVRVKEIPAFESKNLKTELQKSISVSTDRTNLINTNSISNAINQPTKAMEKLEDILTNKYEDLMKKVQNGIEMLGTVEENRGEYPNIDPFGLLSNTHTQSHISNTKKVFFEKVNEDRATFRLLDLNLFLTIYNKAPPQKKYFKKSEINLLIKIQKQFKGLYIREVERSLDRLKVRDALLEIMVLLTGKAYDNAIKKITFKRLKKEFHDPFNNINDELKFEDKLQFRLPNRFYNFSNIDRVGAN